MVRGATWVIPAVVLALSGIAKLVDPSGAVPRAIESSVSRETYALLLRALGVVEIAVASLLAVPRTRLGARYVAFALLTAFSAFVAFNASDARFLGNCGCFGQVRLPGAVAGEGYVAILVRNAALCAILAVGAALETRRHERFSDVAVNAVLASGLVLLGTLYAAEKTVASHDRALLEAKREGERHGQSLLWKIPDLDVLREDGTPTTARRELRGGDHVVFMSTTCPHCERLAPGWAALGRALAAKGERVVLVAIDGGERMAEFKRAHGCADCPHLVLRRREDATRLGLPGVPHLLVLDRDLRVALDEGHDLGATFSSSLALLDGRVAGLEDAAWDRIAAYVYGLGADASGSPRTGPDGVLEVPVTAPTGGNHRLVVLTSATLPSHMLEVAVGLNDADVVEGIVPLAAGGYVRLVAPRIEGFDALRGLTLREAFERAKVAADAPTLESTTWRALADMLDRYGGTRLGHVATPPPAAN